ncbi:MAG: HEAT repeat domain-containing protein [Planctomycetes bacterium]|nr:HEAT repeat domain-containing protein [Planctomycetota bacterium]
MVTTRTITLPSLAVVACVAVGFFLRSPDDVTVGLRQQSANECDTSFEQRPQICGDGISSHGATVGRSTSGFVLHAPIGSSYEYRLTMNTDLRLSNGSDTRSQRVSFDLRAGLSIRVEDRYDEGIQVVWQLADIAFEPAPEDEGNRIADELSRPVHLRLEKDGRIESIAFAEEQGPRARNLLRSLVASWHARLPIGADLGSRICETDDDSGRHRRRYSYEFDTAQRILTVTTERITDASAPSSDHGRREVRGVGAIAYSEEVGFFVESRLDETTTLAMESGGPAVEAHTKVRCRLVRSEQGSEHETKRDAERLESLVWSTMDGTEDARLLAHAERLETGRRRLDGVTLDDLLARLRVALEARPLERGNVLELVEDLALAIELHPNCVDEIRYWLHGDRRHEESVEWVLLALARTTRNEARALLVDTMDATDEGLRKAAGMALFAIDAPGENLVAAMVDRLGRGTPSELDLLLTGYLAGHGTAERSQRLMDALVLARKSASISDVDWHRALGNVGSPRILPLLADDFAAPGAARRASALTALIGLVDAESLALLEAKLAGDPSHDVRTSALFVLASRPTADWLPRIESLLARSPHSDLTQAAANILFDRQDADPAIRESWMRLASHPDSAIREAARRALQRAVS